MGKAIVGALHLGVFLFGWVGGGLALMQQTLPAVICLAASVCFGAAVFSRSWTLEGENKSLKLRNEDLEELLVPTVPVMSLVRPRPALAIKRLSGIDWSGLDTSGPLPSFDTEKTWTDHGVQEELDG